MASVTKEEVRWSPAAVVLDDETLTNIVNDLPVRNLGEIRMSITTSNNAALDQFEIATRSGPDDSYQVLFNAAADFTAPEGDLLGASGDLTSLGADSSGWFRMDVSSHFHLRVRCARASGTDTTVTTYISGYAP